jgi:hypothetical protein
MTVIVTVPLVYDVTFSLTADTGAEMTPSASVVLAEIVDNVNHFVAVPVSTSSYVY